MMGVVKTCKRRPKKSKEIFHNQKRERAAETTANDSGDDCFSSFDRVVFSLPLSSSLRLFSPATDLAFLCSCRDLWNWELRGREQGRISGEKRKNKRERRHRTPPFPSPRRLKSCSSSLSPLSGIDKLSDGFLAGAGRGHHRRGGRSRGPSELPRGRGGAAGAGTRNGWSRMNVVPPPPPPSSSFSKLTLQLFFTKKNLYSSNPATRARPPRRARSSPPRSGPSRPSTSA